MLHPSPPRLLFGIDDTHPQFTESQDFGGRLEHGKMDLLLALCREFRGLKVTHFIPCNYALKEQRLHRRMAKKALQLAGQHAAIPGILESHQNEFLLSRHPAWCEFMRSQARKGIFSLELHGWSHFSPYRANAEEFYGLSYLETSRRIEQCRALFKEAGFPRPAGMAPPGWCITPELLRALKAENLFLAGSMHHDARQFRKSKGAGLDGVSPLRVSLVEDVPIVPRNWDLRKGTIARAKELLSHGSLLSVHAHMEKVGVENEVSADNLANLASLLVWLEQEYGEIDFMHFREAAGKD